jgi:SAM-dependent methyltransferase
VRAATRVEAFERCGLASLDDYDDPGYGPIFGHLEAVQADFLAHEAQFRGKSYIWASDALHGWSRSWEYPYAFYHVRKWLADRSQSNNPTVVDLGSGVTYFPFAVAREGAAVVCVDNDPVAERDMNRAVDVVSGAPGSVAFALTDGVTLPFGPESVEALYCISVLEHIEDPIPVVAEVARVLKPGALFVLTNDIDLKGNTDLGPEKFRRLQRLLAERFERVVPEATIHPVRMLDTERGPYPRPREKQIPGLMWRTMTGEMLPLLGGPTIKEWTKIACYGAVLARR